MGTEVLDYEYICNTLSALALNQDYQRVIVPSIWNAKTFEDKISGDTKDQMWKFKDKGDRECCLIPEVTGIIQEMYNEQWSKELPKPVKVFYISRCYRYEKPQAGRYREFTQFGVEILGDITDQMITDCNSLLRECLDFFEITYDINVGVKRGLGYYIANGIEAECPSLGAQKQIAGGGRYKEGYGWAIGVDRLMIAIGDRSSDD